MKRRLAQYEIGYKAFRSLLPYDAKESIYWKAGWIQAEHDANMKLADRYMPKIQGIGWIDV